MKKIAILVALSLGASGLYLALRPSDDLVMHQVWIDHLPTSETDMIAQLLFIEQRGQQVGGAVIHASAWRTNLEAFRHQRSGNTWTLDFPQAKQKAKVKLKAYRCEKKVKPPFQLCLDVTTDRGTVTLYSSDDWRFDDDEGIGARHFPIDKDATVSGPRLSDVLR